MVRIKGTTPPNIGRMFFAVRDNLSGDERESFRREFHEHQSRIDTLKRQIADENLRMRSFLQARHDKITAEMKGDNF